jgi:hypothetical protein
MGLKCPCDGASAAIDFAAGQSDGLVVPVLEKHEREAVRIPREVVPKQIDERLFRAGIDAAAGRIGRRRGTGQGIRRLPSMRVALQCDTSSSSAVDRPPTTRTPSGIAVWDRSVLVGEDGLSIYWIEMLLSKLQESSVKVAREFCKSCTRVLHNACDHQRAATTDSAESVMRWPRVGGIFLASET